VAVEASLWRAIAKEWSLPAPSAAEWAVLKAAREAVARGATPTTPVDAFLREREGVRGHTGALGGIPAP
jgi:hypothetical protein